MRHLHAQSGKDHRVGLASNPIVPYFSRYDAGAERPGFKIPQDGAPLDAIHQMLKHDLDLDN